ncbi:MAG: UvrD-helicase domain-containing protein [Bacteroidota bacterium]
MNKLNIYKASAGSGKTHTLTEEFLKLAILYPENYRRILAVTFTNKAAEEMKQRILNSLNKLVTHGKKADFYHVFKSEFPNLTEIDIIKKASQVRDNILHNYSFFSINTIDSFVQKVIRAFTFEIGVQSGYRIELDTEKVINELTELLARAIDSNKNLKDWLIRFAHYKIDLGKNWDFRAEIKELAKEIFKEQFQALESESKEDKVEDFKIVLDYYQELLKIKNNFESMMQSYSMDARKIFENHQAIDDSLGRNFTTIKNYLLKTIKEKTDTDFEPVKTVLSALDNVELWYAKSAKNDVKEKIIELYPEMNSILKQVLQKLESDFAIYLSANNILSNFHAFGILTNLAELLPDYRQDNNLLLISDTTRILKELIAGNDAPFIYEKIGNRFKHLLIDEFQDTSGFQWKNFKPLIQNSLAENNANLIVGDIKQSIYRWRGGDWRLLLNQVEKEIGNEYIEKRNLGTNWRSKKNIIDFNNYIFYNAAEISQNIFNNKLNKLSPDELDHFGIDIKETITNSYKDTYQHLPAKEGNSGGRVLVEFFESDSRSKSKYREKVIEKLPKTIEDLLLSKKYKAGDIAILVRTNRDGKNIAEALLNYMSSDEKHKKYPIISSESLFLINSFAIRIMINALYHIHNQNDNLHLMALVAEMLKFNKSDKGIQHSDFNQEKIKQETTTIPSRFFKEIDSLKKQNIYEICENLIDIFHLKNLTNQIPYIQTFQELVKEFRNNEMADLEHLLSWWEEKGKTKSVLLSDQDDSLKIMTIHKSKGLAFNIVIIPFFDWGLEKSPLSNTIIWAKPKIAPFNKFEIIPLVYRKSLGKSTFKKEYYEETLYTFMDSINMMYVAFTRPKKELIIYAPDESKQKEIKTVSGLLQKLVTDNTFVTDNKDYIPIPDFFDSSINVFELQALDINANIPESEKSVQEEPFALNEYPVTNWNEKLNILHHAKDFFIESIKYIEEKVNYGNLMHEIFSSIETKEDIDIAINSQYYDGKLSSKEQELLKKKIKSIIESEEVSDWFSDKWNIKNEEAILNTEGEKRIPDRVLFSKTQTLVIDFKFGEKHKEHIDQVKEYINLLQQMKYPDVKGYLYYAEKNIVEEVVA